MNINEMNLYIMVTTIGREILHINEDVDSMLPFVTDGEHTSEDLENVQLLSRSIKELYVLVKKWKPSILDRV